MDDEDFGQEEYEAAMQQYAAEVKHLHCLLPVCMRQHNEGSQYMPVQQVAGDDEYEGAQSLLASSLEEQQRLLQQQQRAEQQRQGSVLPPADSLSRTKAQNLLKQIVDGKLDGVLPEVPAGSPEEDRMEADMAAYMDTFKMQVSFLLVGLKEELRMLECSCNHALLTWPHTWTHSGCRCSCLCGLSRLAVHACDLLRQ